jgi:hypothetical protein
VSVDDVHDVISVSSAEVPDAKGFENELAIMVSTNKRNEHREVPYILIDKPCLSGEVLTILLHGRESKCNPVMNALC